MYNDVKSRYPLRYPPIFKGYIMAIDLKDFKQTKYPNLYKSINKDKTKGHKYLMWLKIDGKLHKKILGHSEHINPNDNLTDKKAHDKINDYKKDYENGYTSSDKMKLDELFKIYFDIAKDTDWNQNKKEFMQGIFTSH